MSQLGQLKIVGALTPCSRVVRVQNQKPGATVLVMAKPKAGAAFVAGGGPMRWPDEEFSIPRLPPDTVVTVTQTAPGFTPSDPASAAVGKEPTAAELGAGKFAPPLYVCAECVYMYNLPSGASVRLESNGQPLGTAIVLSTGEAFIELNRELRPADNLKALVSCGGPPSIIVAGVTPVPPPNPLPPPTVEPAVECDQVITVSGIIPGAQVTVSRGTQPLSPICSPTGRLMMFPIKGLRRPADDPITAVQAFPHDRCRLLSPAGSTPLKAQITPPLLIEPLCEGLPEVGINDMRPGATVELTVNGATLVFGAASTYIAYPVTPLMFPQTVSVRQNTCGAANTWSQPRKAVVGSAKPIPPKLTAPANNAVNVSTNPMLAWLDTGTYCNRANPFEAQIASNAAFTQNLQTITLPGATNVWFPLNTLKFGTLYHWRVRSRNAGQPASGWTTFKFTTVAKSKSPAPNTPTPEPTRFCFIEDCCPFNRKRVEIWATSLTEAWNQAIKNAPSNCSVTPVDCNTRVPGCSEV